MKENGAKIRIPNTEIKKEIYLKIDNIYIKYYQNKFKQYYEEFINLPRLSKDIERSKHSKYMELIANSIEKVYASREEIPRLESQFKRELVLSLKKSMLFKIVDEEKRASKGRIDFFGNRKWKCFKI